MFSNVRETSFYRKHTNVLTGFEYSYTQYNEID